MSRFAPSFLIRIVAWLLCASVVAAPALAWVSSGKGVWANGTIPIRITLGNTETYQNGLDPNGTASLGSLAWNPYMSRVKITTSMATAKSGSIGNGVNEIYRALTYQGEPIPSNVLAFTVIRTSANKIVEGDVIVNHSIRWDAYTGYIQYVYIDLQRVITHEVGHVLGLAHPDAHGQWVAALMNSTISSVDAPAVDDIEGIANLYGVNPAHPPVVPVIEYFSTDRTLEFGSALDISVNVNNAGSYKYQWYKDDGLIPGATSYTYSVSEVTKADAGRYHCVVTGISGSVSSGKLTLTILSAKAPVVSITSYNVSQVYETQTINIYSNLSEGSTPIKYQWQKDGVDLPGQTASQLSISNVRLQDAGSYRLIASNDGGVSTSAALTFTVLALLPPTLSTGGSSKLSVEDGANLYIFVSVSSPVNTMISWYKDDLLLNSTSASFYLDKVGVESGGLYRVEVSNGAGTASRTYTVEVVPRQAPYSMTLYGPSTVSEGGTANFYASEIKYSSISSDDYLYKWYRNGVRIQESYYSDSSYTIAKASSSDEGEYWCEVVTPMGLWVTNSIKLALTKESRSGYPSAAWTCSCQADGIAYFGYSGDVPVVERVDLSDGSRLPTLSSPIPVRSIAVSSAGVFVGDGFTVHRIQQEGSTSLLYTWPSSSPYQRIAASNSLVYIVPPSYSYGPVCINAVSGAELTRGNNYIYHNRAIVATRESNQLFMISGDAFSPLVYWYQFDGSGFVSSSSIEVLSSGIVRAFLSADESLAFDQRGDVYDMATKKHVASLGLVVDQLADLQDGTFLVQSGARLHRVDADLLHIQTMALSPEVLEVFAKDGVAYGMKYDSSSGHVLASVLDLSEMRSSISMAEVLDPIGQPAGFEDAVIDKEGKVWFLSRSQPMLACWDPLSRSYLQCYKLIGAPLGMAYSAENDSIYFSYSGGLVTRLRIHEEAPREDVFARTSAEIDYLIAAGPYIVTHTHSVYGGALRSYTANGDPIDLKELIGPSMSMVWNPVTQRIYRFRDSTSPNDLMYSVVNADGSFGAQGESPYHGEVNARHPIRLGSDGSVLIGSGQLFAESDLTIKATLGIRFMDAAYCSTSWVTLGKDVNGAIVRRWGDGYAAPDKQVVLDCTPRRIFALANQRILVLGIRDGAPRFFVLDSDLTVLSKDGGGTVSRLANLSVQAEVGTGSNYLVPGFVLKGSKSKRLLMRGVGPSLAQFSVTGLLADPQLTLYNSKSAVLAGNDDWSSLNDFKAVRALAKDLYAFNLPDNSRDSVLLASLGSGAYTAEVKGAASGTGRALVEVYDADEAPGDMRAVNMSARCKVAPTSVAIGGFVVQGNKPMKLLIRAIGPKLADYSVTGVLADPKLTLFSGQTAIHSNNNWSANADQALLLKETFTSTGAFQLNEGSKDAAMLVELQPGNYTVWMESADGGSGVGLLELYVVE